MLKFTYAETGLYLEHLTQSLEEWVAMRVLLSLRAGQRLLVEHSTASILLLADLAEFHHLEATVRQETVGTVALSVGDAEYIEVSLRGTWIASHPEGVEGVFVVMMSHRTEFVISKLWQESQSQASSLRR